MWPTVILTSRCSWRSGVPCMNEYGNQLYTSSPSVSIETQPIHHRSGLISRLSPTKLVDELLSQAPPELRSRRQIASRLHTARRPRKALGRCRHKAES